MDQNTQFLITVGTVIGAFIWLRYDIHSLRRELKDEVKRLDDKFDRVNERIDRVNESVTSLRETVGWLRGRFSEPLEPVPRE